MISIVIPSKLFLGRVCCAEWHFKFSGEERERERQTKLIDTEKGQRGRQTEIDKTVGSG